jgi:ASC-1-like (ASCH) protein
MQPGEFTFGDSVVIELKTDDEEIKRKTSAMYQYYSHDEEKQYGVVGIKISLVK